jgi:hypothetical protein
MMSRTGTGRQMIQTDARRVMIHNMNVVPGTANLGEARRTKKSNPGFTKKK